ncbi:MAG: hypothetical protein RLZZ399_2305 [Verrucomicrobiota bacterium]|jgi:HSP20 family protein
MNTLTKWNPFQWGKSDLFRELEGIERRLENLFERNPAGALSPFQNFGPFPRDTGELLSSGVWVPTVDISEDDRQYVLKADLPEIPKADVKVSVREGTLEISGERKAEKEEKGRRYHRIERSYGAFQRAFTLPPGVEAEKARADFSEGVLTIRIPKSEKASTKAIEVKVS